MIHKYFLNGLYVLLDVNSGAVHVVDKIVFDMLDYISLPIEEKCPQGILHNEGLKQYSEKDILDSYNEIFCLYETGNLFSEDKYERFLNNGSVMPIKAACLHVSHDCNLRCNYCFASTGDFGQTRKLMSFDIGKKAIDFLIKNSQTRKNLEIDFFGGEPLMNFDVIKEIVKYALDQEKKYDKNFRFAITTNGILLDDDKIDFINKYMYNVVLSADGRKKINDKMRQTCNGNGSYDIIMPKFKKLVSGRKYNNYYIRGTFTKNNLDFVNDILHLSSLGYDQISIEPVVTSESNDYAISYDDLPTIFSEYETLLKEMISRNEYKRNVMNQCQDVKEIKNENKPFNFFHFMIDLDQGPCVIKRLRGCGSGNEYIAITPEGDIYPCHQFVGKDEWKMGNVIDNSFDLTLKEIFANTNIYTKLDCNNCWAKFYCSGGCNANNLFCEGSLNKPYKLSCDIIKKRLECAIVLQIMEKIYL